MHPRWDKIHELDGVRGGPPWYLGPEERQEPIVMARAAAESTSVGVESKSGDQRPIDLDRVDQVSVCSRLVDSQDARNKVGLGVTHLVKFEGQEARSDAWASDPLTAIKRVFDELKGREFLGQVPNIQEEGPCAEVAVKLFHLSRQDRCLAASLGGVERDEVGLDRQAERSLIRRELLSVSIHIVAQSKRRPADRPPEGIGRGPSGTSTAMPFEARFGNPQFRWAPHAAGIADRLFWSPTGLIVGSPKRGAPREHGRGVRPAYQAVLF